MARPTTAITAVQRVELFEIEGLALRVHYRAAQLKLELAQVAGRMGVGKSRLVAILDATALRLDTLERLEAALEFTRADWDRELPEYPSLEQSYQTRLDRILKSVP